MSEKLKFEIGGIGLSIHWDGSLITGWPHPLYEPFVKDISPQITLNVFCSDLPQHVSRLLFDGEEEGYWKLFQNDQGYVLETFDTQTQKKSNVCLISPYFREADVYIEAHSNQSESLRKLFNERPKWFFPLLMQPLAQLLLVNVLAEKEGIMVHGLGINDRGKGIAFLGQSGAGKSTMAGFWKDQKSVDILSDEHIIIRKKDGKFWLYGTPWPGMAAASSSEIVPLDRIYFLEHASENRILGHGHMKDLMPLLYLPFWAKKKLNSVLESCEDLFKTFEMTKLGFLKNKNIVEFVRDNEA